MYHFILSHWQLKLAKIVSAYQKKFTGQHASALSKWTKVGRFFMESCRYLVPVICNVRCWGDCDIIPSAAVVIAIL